MRIYTQPFAQSASFRSYLFRKRRRRLGSDLRGGGGAQEKAQFSSPASGRGRSRKDFKANNRKPAAPELRGTGRLQDFRIL